MPKAIAPAGYVTINDVASTAGVRTAQLTYFMSMIPALRERLSYQQTTAGLAVRKGAVLVFPASILPQLVDICRATNLRQARALAAELPAS